MCKYKEAWLQQKEYSQPIGLGQLYSFSIPLLCFGFSGIDFHNHTVVHILADDIVLVKVVIEVAKPDVFSRPF